MSFYYPQPSNKSWADMSKSEREATGQTKKEYNRSTGQGIISKPPPEQVVIDRPMPMPTPITGPGPDRPINKPPGSIAIPNDRGPDPYTMPPRDPRPMPTPITGPGPGKPISRPIESISAPIDTLNPFPGPRPEFGGSIGQPPGTVRTSDFRDSDGDGVDDRDQRRPGGKNINARRRKAQSLKDDYTKNIIKNKGKRKGGVRY